MNIPLPSQPDNQQPTWEALIQEVSQLRQALAKAQARTDFILKATNDAIYEWDLLSDTLSWNEGFLTLIGYPREKIESTLNFWSSLVHPEDADRVQQSLENALIRGETHWVEEYRFRRADGSYADVLDRGYVIFDEQCKAVRMVGAMQDISGRKAAERAFAALSEEYAFLLDHLPSLVFRLLPDGKGDFVNSRWQEYTGLMEQQILGEGWLKVLHPLDAVATLRAFQQAASRGEAYQAQYRLRRHDGTYRWFQADALPYKDKEGTVLKWYGSCTDIEEQKQAQQAILQSMQAFQEAKAEAEAQQKYLDTLLMNIPAPISIVSGPDQLLTFVNPPLRKLLGDRLRIGEPFRNSLEGLPAGWFLDLMEQVYKTGEARSAQEMPIYLDTALTDGMPVAYQNLLFQAIPDVSGTLNQVVIFGQDVTEQVKARQKVEQSESRLQKILDALPHITWTFQPGSTNISFFNQRWYEYTGLSSEESSRGGWLQALHPEDAADIKAFQAEGRSLEQAPSVAHRYRRFDGQYRWHLVRIVAIPNPSGQSTLLLGTATDIEEQKQAQARLEETLQELHAKNFELDQYVYKTSHDLRAPLSTILGLVNIFKQEPEEHVRLQYMDLIESRVQKLDHFIQSMLAYSRNTRTQLTVERIDFASLVEECLDELSSQKQFDRLQITWQLTGEPFYSDRFRLKIIFANLLSNAVKYQDFSKTESYLRLTIDVTSRRATIQFEDNGVGISQAYQEKIFDMFVRATQQSEGSGLGLYIVKQAVAVLQGEITLESQPGQGTVFMITLPQRQ